MLLLDNTDAEHTGNLTDLTGDRSRPILSFCTKQISFFGSKALAALLLRVDVGKERSEIAQSFYDLICLISIDRFDSQTNLRVDDL